MTKKERLELFCYGLTLPEIRNNLTHSVKEIVDRINNFMDGDINKFDELLQGTMTITIQEYPNKNNQDILYLSYAALYGAFDNDYFYNKMVIK